MDGNPRRHLPRNIKAALITIETNPFSSRKVISILIESHIHSHPRRTEPFSTICTTKMPIPNSKKGKEKDSYRDRRPSFIPYVTPFPPASSNNSGHTSTHGRQPSQSSSQSPLYPPYTSYKDLSGMPKHQQTIEFPPPTRQFSSQKTGISNYGSSTPQPAIGSSDSQSVTGAHDPPPPDKEHFDKNHRSNMKDASTQTNGRY